MSSSNAEGVLRRSERNKKPNDNVKRLQNLAESGSGLSQTKAAAADAQASYIQPGSSNGTGAHTTNQSQSVQSQSKPSYSTQEEQPSPDGTGETVPGEPNDQPMGDAESEREPSESPTASPRRGHMAENAAESGSPAPVGTNDSSDSLDEVLTDLKKLSNGRDRDGEPDAWSRLGRSNVLLVRYGPYKAAKYRVQPGNGYNTQGLQKVSKQKTRISHVMYEGEDGEDHYRYSRDNIVGIVGVAIYERKNVDKVSDTAPPAFVKIKWQYIDAEHQKLLTRGNSWITKTDLVRLTDRATAEQKISEAWDKQEERHIQWQFQIGRDSPDRSPTPCPLDSFKAQKEERIKRELTREPSMPSAQNMELDPEGWRLGSRQPAVNNTKRFDSVSVKQELDDEDNEDNDLFVNDSSTNARDANGQNASGQIASGQDSNGLNNNGLNNDASSGPDQNRPPPKLSKFYRKWLRRTGIADTDFNELDDASIARFEAAAYVYVEQLRKSGYVVQNDMDVDI
ncbi:hypothetical protein N7524_008682 [Penicillium chrysogenum]|nr:hypothetical protein N7524_008682 [Penicillium chrysogenum]